MKDHLTTGFVSAVFVVLAFLFGVLCISSCFTVPEWCAKGQAALKSEISPRVEPPLKDWCVREAKACKAKGIGEAECTPLNRCKDYVARYALITKGLHRSLSALNGFWHDLVKAKVVKE